MTNQILISHAKINVGLRILGKRSDGYHDLETIFYPVKLHDKISVTIQESETGNNSVILRCNKSFLPLTKDNLCYTALEKFFVAFSIKAHYRFEIDIEKNIPVSGGMGGGSSNAASIIKFLVRHFNVDVNANRRKIIELARDIGSDVPFFLVMKPCYAEGRGEVMRVLPDFKIPYDILIANPQTRVSTKWAFEKLALEGKPAKEKSLEHVSKFDPADVSVFVNDFEPLVFKRSPVLQQIKQEMTEAGAILSLMSGSGATMFGIFRHSSPEVKNLMESFSGKGYFTFLSRSG